MSAIRLSPDPALAEESLLAGSLRDCLLPALIFIGADGTVTPTPQARQMLKWDDSASAAAVLPQPLLDLAEEALRAPGGVASAALAVAAKDGSALNFQANALRLPGRQTDVVLVLHDVGPAQRVEPLLLQADRLANVGAISASMAHEVRNAMVACRTFVDLLLEKHQDSELAALVRREMKRIDDMISRMLKHSSTAPGKRALLHVHEVLEEALRLLEPQFADKSLTVERSFAAAPDALEGDEHQLQQAFMNLLLNACEAAPSEGKLRAETYSAPGHDGTVAGVYVTITDNGGGIAQEILPRLFQPFFTTKPEGTGLGLAVTQRIVKEHRGTITVESQPGQGASFRLFLPA